MIYLIVQKFYLKYVSVLEKLKKKNSNGLSQFIDPEK
jgi:hypothetical protein